MYRNSKLHVNDPVNMYPNLVIHRYIQVYILLEHLKEKNDMRLV